MIESGSDYVLQHATSMTNDDLDEIYFQSLFWRLASPKLNEIIDDQFNKILIENNIHENYSDHVDDYENITSIVQPSSIVNTSLVWTTSCTEPDCEESWPAIPKSGIP